MRILTTTLGLLLASALLPRAVLPAAAPRATVPGQAGGASAAAVAKSAERPDLEPFFSGLPGTFVLLDGKTGRRVYYDRERARTPVIPASTFKIPNTLIGLETGVISGPDFALAWDPKVAPHEPWWPATWARDQTLRTALPESVVWFYQEIARRIGPARMKERLARFRYGNQDMSGGIDRFWLGGGLRISADEQVDFLRRLDEGNLGVSARSIALVKDLLVLEQGPGYRLSGKTGTGRLGKGQTGWLVGWLERGGVTSYYAYRVEGQDIFNTWPKPRRAEAVRGILRQLGALPPSAGNAPPG